MADADPGAVLRRSKTIAVVGLSSNPARPSHGVARYLQSQGYRIIPVNPYETEVLGEGAYPSVGAIPEPVDLVDVFRASDAAPEVARDAVRAGAKALSQSPSTSSTCSAHGPGGRARLRRGSMHQDRPCHDSLSVTDLPRDCVDPADVHQRDDVATPIEFVPVPLVAPLLMVRSSS